MFRQERLHTGKAREPGIHRSEVCPHVLVRHSLQNMLHVVPFDIAVSHFVPTQELRPLPTRPSVMDACLKSDKVCHRLT